MLHPNADGTPTRMQRKIVNFQLSFENFPLYFFQSSPYFPIPHVCSVEYGGKSGKPTFCLIHIVEKGNYFFCQPSLTNFSNFPLTCINENILWRSTLSPGVLQTFPCCHSEKMPGKKVATCGFLKD